MLVALIAALAAGPVPVDAHAVAIRTYNSGIEHWQVNEREEALADVEKAIRLDPSLMHAYLALGQFRRLDGDLEGAGQVLLTGMNVARDSRPFTARMSYQLGLVSWALAQARGVASTDKQEHYAEAIAAFDIAISNDPNDARAYLWRARCYDRLDQPAKADLDYRKSIELRPSYMRAYVELGLMYIDFGYPNVGLAVLEVGAKVDEHHPEIWKGFGRAYLELERPKEAIVSLKKAKALEPDDAMVRFQLGLAHADVRDRKGAIEELQAFLAKAGEEVPAHYKQAANATIARMQDAL